MSESGNETATVTGGYGAADTARPDYGEPLADPDLGQRERDVVTHLKAWARRELAMHGDGVGVEERVGKNP